MPLCAGHYVKMVHNGIEYGMLQAYAEGYEILHASKDFKLNLCNIANLWNHGSVVRSWLNELAARAFEKDADLTTIKGFVEDSGEGRWTVEEAMHLDVPAPVITLSLLTRFRSRQARSEEHTSELQSPCNLVCRLLLEKKKKKIYRSWTCARMQYQIIRNHLTGTEQYEPKPAP